MIQFWDNQEKIIHKIVESFQQGVEVVVLNGPTGSGKTLINLISGKMSGGAYYTNPLRVLVDKIKLELETKFSGENLGWGVMGRDGYECPYLIDKETEQFNKNWRNSPDSFHLELKRRYELKIKELTADGAPCQTKRPIYLVDGEKVYQCPFKENHKCPYYNDRDKSMTSINAVTTFDYFVRGIYDEDKGISDLWPKKPVLVMDEAHFLPTKLADFYSINITERGFPDFPYDSLLMNIDKDENYSTEPTSNKIVTSEIAMKEFLDLMSPYQDEQELYLDKLTGDYEGSEEGFDIDYFGRRTTIESAIQKQTRLVNRLHFYRTMLNSKDIEWIFNKDEKGMYWKPYSPAPFVRKLWGSFEHILLSSATFFDIPEYLDDLGLSGKRYEIIDVESTFDPSKAPIIPVLGGKLNKKNFDNSMENVVIEIDRILEKHPNERGLIHCHSYPYQQEILLRSKHSDRFIDHTTQTRQEKLKEFVSLKEGNSVLLSVNMGEGIDLKDDSARFQILVKCPYPNRGDKWTKLHADRSPRWYRQQTIIEIMQMCGRIIRSKEDWGTTYFIDEHIINLLSQVKLPDWFENRIREGEKVRKEQLSRDIDDLLGI